MILLIDNYDSFVYNLARYTGRLGHERRVVRNDAITLDEIAMDPPEAIIISPGPCSPREAGISNAIVQHFSGRIPILGVCLGHQCIGEAFGGRTIRAPRPVHGRSSAIEHQADGIFMGLPNPLEAARYHSLMIELSASSPLDITATTDDEDSIIMAVQHKTDPTFGIQFHPESVLTPYGLDILRNFLLIADQWKDKKAAA
ncbi:MAG: aminodeoxychorismate/anthranilate synthase component II [Rhodospirillales bacterium]|nr:aminodeoxychorismate/anthranilate synthase component II [Rhodospirillales bacterium]